ncbi:MAG TPA: hypothetical protein VFO60_04505 [Candidatus Dormibacteraeota bacterium]|nr:hypothetical protein [Candidatus Dormibacteraeota bacterium]
MSEDLCSGCGRDIEGDVVACPGCGRPLARGTEVPPGWDIAAGTAAAVVAPRWRLAGIATAQPAEAAIAAPAELFRAPAAPDPAADDTLQPGGPGWRVRARPGFLRDAPEEPAPPVPRRRPRSVVYWGLVAGILATSASAVLLLAAHLMHIH